MTISQNAFWAFFAFLVLLIAGSWIFMLVRGERVGKLRVRGRIGLDLKLINTTGPATHVGIGVAREGGASRRVLMRVAVPMALYPESIAPADALELSRLLEEASSRLRAP